MSLAGREGKGYLLFVWRSTLFWLLQPGHLGFLLLWKWIVSFDDFFPPSSWFRDWSCSDTAGVGNRTLSQWWLTTAPSIPGNWPWHWNRWGLECNTIWRKMFSPPYSHSKCGNSALVPIIYFQKKPFLVGNRVDHKEHCTWSLPQRAWE